MEAVRVVAFDGAHVIGGGQILMSSVPLVGKVGYVSRGPVVSSSDPEVTRAVIGEIRRAAYDNGVRHLTVQPPTNGFSTGDALEAAGFTSTIQTVAPPCSVVVDVARPLDDIQAGLHKKTRYNIRLAERRGVTVREGTEADLDTYYEIYARTADRQGFSPFPRGYYATMWRVFSPKGFARLSLVECENEVVSAQLAISFGDTVINKLPGWSGAYGERHPNELLHWDTIRWAQANGYRFYDLEGIECGAAEAILTGEPIRRDMTNSVTRFKLGFGGEAVKFPGAYFDAPSAPVRWMYGSVLPRVSHWRPVRKSIGALRTSRRGRAR
jgi:lipid II:glycine glycyltransferase (peptidoglycan interpeptide bridge formation enzyme)